MEAPGGRCGHPSQAEPNTQRVGMPGQRCKSHLHAYLSEAVGVAVLEGTFDEQQVCSSRCAVGLVHPW